MKRNEKYPYVICHMLQSIDGRISGQLFRSSATASLSQIYKRISEEYHADAIFYGRTTADEIFTYENHLDLKSFLNQKIDKNDYICLNENKEWIVIVDDKGNLAWNNESLNHPRLKNKNVIEVLSENTSDEYLCYLKSLGISYIFAGKDSLSMKKALEKLKSKFQIQTILLQGGGIINESFVNENLIDELSLVISPVIGGESHIPTSFECKNFIKPVLREYSLIKAEILSHSGLWLNYKKENKYE